MLSSIIDMQEALERVQNDAKFLLELLQDLERDYRKKRKIIEQAIQQRDFDKLKEFIHSVKGAAGNVSAKPIHNSFMIIEYLITSQDIGLIKEVLYDIDQQFLELQAYIARFKKGQV